MYGITRTFGFLGLFLDVWYKGLGIRTTLNYFEKEREQPLTENLPGNQNKWMNAQEKLYFTPICLALMKKFESDYWQFYFGLGGGIQLTKLSVKGSYWVNNRKPDDTQDNWQWTYCQENNKI